MENVWMIASGKGGVGKSTLSSALAVCFASAGTRVVLLDADLGLRCADLQLDMQDRVVYDVADYAHGDCTLNEALCVSSEHPTLYLLPSSQTKPSELSDKDIQKIVRALKKRFDLILIDCPAGVGRGLKNAFGAIGEWVLVATPDDVSLRDAERVCELIRQKGCNTPYIVFNRMDKKMVRHGEMREPKEMAQQLDMPLLGVIPESRAIYEGLLNHKNAYECGDEAVQNAINNIMLRMRGEQVPEEDYKKKVPFFVRLRAGGKGEMNL